MRIAVFMAALSGACALAYEVAWTRALAQVLGSSTYAFSLILVAILLGIALGSLVHGRLGGVRTFARAQVGVALSAALVLPLLARLPDLQLFLFRFVDDHRGVLAVQLALCSAVILLPAWCMGAGFPALAAAVSRDAAGHGIGRIYAANTLGAIVGSMGAGFLALPHAGTQRTLVVVVAVNAGLAALAWVRAELPRRGLVLAAAALALAAVTPRWDPYVLDAGIAIGGPATARAPVRMNAATLGRGSELLDYRDGLTATISVRRDESQLYLKTNGKTDGTSRGDMPTQLLLGLLPALVHPQPRHGLVIGLGTGVSARAALAAPDLRALDVVEIEPEVVRAARLWFAAVNTPLFDDRRARIVVDDARAFLRTSNQRYDFIVSEPSNPWIAGVASLFSVDHYQRCAARLAPDGIVAQWVQIYALRDDLLRMILASMREVFPHSAVYSFQYGDLIVLGSRAPLPAFDAAEITRRITAWGAAGELGRVLGVRSGGGLAGGCLLDDADVARFSAGARLHTEDRARLEFAAPQSLYLATRDSNAELLRAARRGPAPVLAAPLDAAGRLDAARLALRAQRPLDARAWIEPLGAAVIEADAAALTLRGEIALALRQADAAAADWRRALGLDPANWRAADRLGMLQLMQGRAPEALALLDAASAAAARATPPDFEPSARYLELLLRGERHAAARAVAAGVLELLPAAPQDSSLAGRLVGLAAQAHAAGGELESGERLAQRALALRAENTAAWRALAAIAHAHKDDAAAAGWLERLVQYRQTGPDVLLPLAQTYLRLGDRRRARRILDDLLRQEPQQPAARRLRDQL
jgi:spermidine synthase